MDVTAIPSKPLCREDDRFGHIPAELFQPLAAIEKQLNRKLLQLRVEYYIELLMCVYGDEKTRNQLISEAKKRFEKENKDEIKMDNRQIGKTLLESGANLTAIIESFCSVLSPNTVLGKAFAVLLEKISL